MIQDKNLYFTLKPGILLIRSRSTRLSIDTVYEDFSIYEVSKVSITSIPTFALESIKVECQGQQ